MADETRERSTTSAGLWPEAVLSDLASTNRWLYFMKGTSSDRDKRLALGVLLEWLGSHSGPITIQGQNGTATLTNLLLTLAATGNLKVEVSATGVTVTQTNGSNSVTITKDGVTVGMNGGAVTIDGNSVTVAGGGKTVAIETDSVSVTEGDYSATIKKNSVEVAYGDDVATVTPESVEVTDGNKTTYVYSDKVQSNRLDVEYAGTYSGTFSGNNLSASDLVPTPEGGVPTLAGVSSAMVVTNSAATSPKLFFDLEPAVGYEIVVDYQDDGLKTLEVMSGTTSSAQQVCYQAPNTVRRYVYKGGTTGWACMY